MTHHENVDDPVFEPFFDPPMSQTKGRNKMGRHKGGIEMALQKRSYEHVNFVVKKEQIMIQEIVPRSRLSLIYIFVLYQ